MLKTNKEKDDETKSNLLAKTVEPFPIVVIASHIVTIDEKDISNTVSADRVTPASSLECMQENRGSRTEPTKIYQTTHERDGDERRVRPGKVKTKNAHGIKKPLLRRGL